MEQPDISALMEMLQSPAGQRLLELIQQQDSPALQSAVAHGNFTQAKEMLSDLMNDPEAQKLLRELRGN